MRAVAVALVMLFHFGYFPGGWVGVQVFFTLSGYLITGILLQAKDKALPSYLGRFYWHRVVRIMPVLYVFVLISGATYAVFGMPSSFTSDWYWLVSFLANFARMRPGDLGDAFVHIWSLAVEQQFYLVWPLLVFFLPPKVFRLVVAGLLVLTPLIRLAMFHAAIDLGYDEHYAGKAVYVLPFAQFDAFAAGAAIPLWSLDRMRNAGRWLTVAVGAAAAAGLAVLKTEYLDTGGAFIGSWGYAMYLLQNHGYVWGYSLLNVLSMLCIVCALQRIGPMKLLETRFLVWMGKISYGIYVYHLPLLLAGAFALAKLRIGAHGFVVPMFFMTWTITVLLVSHASFRWLETPFLKLKDYWRRPGAPQASRG